MTEDRTRKAVREARAFIEAWEYGAKNNDGFSWLTFGSKDSGALRRASMELTRSLAEMRKR